MKEKLILLLIVSGILGLAVSSVRAEQITNVFASASSYWTGTCGPIYAVNGAGLSGSTHTNVWLESMWATDTSDIDGAWIIIDLKMNYKLDPTNTLKVWNYNDSAATNRGIKSAAFFCSADSVTFTEETNVTTDAAGTNTFDQADGLNTYSNYNTVAFNTSPTVRYIKITVNGVSGIGNYGDATFVGLSEVQAFGAFVSDPTNSLGEQITVSNATASSTYPGGYGPTNTIDGSGLTGLAHDTGAGNIWFTAVGVTNAYVDFDIGVSKKLGAVRIWNNNSLETRGMRTVDILVSDDATFTTGVITNHNDIELLKAPVDTQDYDNPQVIDMNGVEGRYVRITSIGNSNPTWGATYVGLSEVQFFLFVPPPPPAGTMFGIR